MDCCGVKIGISVPGRTGTGKMFTSMGMYQTAIDFAAWYYGFYGGLYDPNNIEFLNDPRAFGFTNPRTGEIFFSKLAFYSRSSLQATGFHESVHQDQVRRGQIKFDRGGNIVNSSSLEVAASAETLFYAGRLDLDNGDVKDETSYLIKNLGWDNKS